MARSEQAAKTNVPILNLDGANYILAPCCTPVPDDPILGHYIAATNTEHIHRKDCTHVQRGYRVDPENWKEMQWNPSHAQGFNAKLDIEFSDSHSTLERITGEIAKQKSSITGFTMLSNTPEVTKVALTIQIKDGNHLSKVINAIRAIDKVRLVSRHLESDHNMKPVDVEEDI